jgi:hypothetical protein
LREGGTTDAKRLSYAFRRCLARSPDDDEAELLMSLLKRESQRFVTGAANPWDLVADKPEEALRLPPNATPAQFGGWTLVARVLLNLDETITKE